MTAEGGNGQAPAPAAEPVVRPRTIAFALSAWELEKTRDQRADTPRARAALLQAHKRLREEIEERKGVPPADRSIILTRAEARDSVLLIHGATNTPSELRSLAAALHEAGYNVYAPLLPSRASLVSGMGEIVWRACLHEVLLRQQLLRRASRRVHVLGLSFGAALAVHAARQERPYSLLLLAPALVPRLPLMVRLLLRLGVHRLQWVRQKYGWSLEVLEAMEKARPQLSQLDLPVYAAQCQDDERISPLSLRLLQRKVRHAASRFRLYPSGGHLILRAHGEGGLHAEIVSFLGEI